MCGPAALQSKGGPCRKYSNVASAPQGALAVCLPGIGNGEKPAHLTRHGVGGQAAGPSAESNRREDGERVETPNATLNPVSAAPANTPMPSNLATSTNRISMDRGEKPTDKVKSDLSKTRLR